MSARTPGLWLQPETRTDGQPAQRWVVMSGDRKVGRAWRNDVSANVTLQLDGMSLTEPEIGGAFARLRKAFGYPDEDPAAATTAYQDAMQEAQPPVDPILEEVKTERAGTP